MARSRRASRKETAVDDDVIVSGGSFAGLSAAQRTGTAGSGHLQALHALMARIIASQDGASDIARDG